MPGRSRDRQIGDDKQAKQAAKQAKKAAKESLKALKKAGPTAHQPAETTTRAPGSTAADARPSHTSGPPPAERSAVAAVVRVLVIAA